MSVKWLVGAKVNMRVMQVGGTTNSVSTDAKLSRVAASATFERKFSAQSATCPTVQHFAIYVIQGTSLPYGRLAHLLRQFYVSRSLLVAQDEGAFCAQALSSISQYGLISDTPSICTWYMASDTCSQSSTASSILYFIYIPSRSTISNIHHRPC